MENKYIEEKLSTREIGNICRVKHSTILYWLKKFGIETRNYSQAQKQAYTKGRETPFHKNHKINKGREPWNKGLKKEYSINSGENNPAWKGDKVGYHALHRYIEKRKNKPEECEICNKKREIELSFDHRLGNYTRNTEDYKYVCITCHRKFEKLIGRR